MKRNGIFFNVISLCVVAFFLASCTDGPGNRLLDYYESEELEPEEFIRVGSEEYIPVIETSSMNNIVKDYKKKGYVVVGSASFNGRWTPRIKLVDHARDIGASLVIVTAQNSNDQVYVAQIPYTQNHTVYHQGSGNTIGNTYGNVSVNGRRIADYTANSYSHTNYSGTSTYQTVEQMPIPIQLKEFEQKAIFMSLSNKKDIR